MREMTADLPACVRKSVFAGFAFLFVFPASTNYRLDGYGFGGGGEENMTSTNYAIDGITGEQSEDQLQGTNYDLGPGLLLVQQANVPPAPTFTNPSNYYNKLKIVISTGNNPTDTKFAIAISDDNWSTTRYIQNDNTVGATLGSEDRQTYAAWGGVSGFDAIGLASNTTYKVKVKAMQGKFTETGYGPESSAATVNPQLSFDIDVAATDTDTNPPFMISFDSLPAGTVTDSPVRVWVDFSTNGASGGRVYVSGANGGLSSVRAGATIASVTGDLSVLSSGYGAQGVLATQGSGGPFSIVSPYDASAAGVGAVSQALQEIFSSGAPVSTGRGAFLLKAKSSSVTPAAVDYSDILTVVASASF
jgi:hypothetical protein